MEHSAQSIVRAVRALGHERTVIGRAAGLVLIAWCAWWAEALVTGRLFGAEWMWLRYPSLGADFWTQTDHAARLTASGVDPYRHQFPLFHYPPIVLWLFRWTPLFEPTVAFTLWLVVIASSLVLAAWLIGRVRRSLGLFAIPPTALLVAVVFSFPAIFAMERGNFDLVTLLAVIAALRLRRAGFGHADFLAGCVLAIGPWAKLYPALIGLGLIALRWWRSLAGFAVAGAAIGAAAPAQTLQAFGNLQRLRAFTGMHERLEWAGINPWSHSLAGACSRLLAILSELTDATFLAAVPGYAAALLVLSPLALWVLLGVSRSAGREALAFPTLLWVVALGSFVPEVANDYSLVFLPLAALSVWARRDPGFVHAAMLFLLLWWQPFTLPLDGALMLFVKLMGLGAVGVSLVERALEASRKLPPRSADCQKQPGAAGTSAVRALETG